MPREIFETSEGRFVIAQYSERNGQYIADMNASSARLTGCSQVSARTVDGIACSANVTRYKTLSGARRALKRINEEN